MVIAKNGRIIITLIVLFITMTFIIPCIGHEVSLPGRIPVLDNPERQPRIISFIPAACSVEYLDKKTIVREKHPLGRYFAFYKIKVGENSFGWVSPRITVRPDNRQLDINYGADAWPGIFFLAGIVMFCAVPLWYFYITKYMKRPFVEIEKILLGAVLIITIRWILFSIIIIASGNIITSASDDPGYFETAMGYLKGNFTGPWNFTIGQGFLYLPFIILLQAQEFYDIALPVAICNGYVLMPLTLVLSFLIVKKITGSFKTGLTVALLWAVIPFFYHHIQGWEQGVHKAFFAIPSCKFDFRLYCEYIAMGFNAMSDTPSAFLILSIIYLCLVMPTRLRYMAAIGFLFGFACLIRINNIFFSLIIAWLFWLKMQSKITGWQKLSAAITLPVIIFILTFSPQLIINWLHFGNIFTFPYVLHGFSKYSAFNFNFVPQNIRFLGGVNWLYLSMGAAGFLFLRDKQLRITYALWAIPVFLYFCGYEKTYADPVRFILPTFTAFLGVFASLELWKNAVPQEKIVLIATIAAGMLLVSPSGYTFNYVQPWDMQQFSWGSVLIRIIIFTIPILSAAAIMLFLRKNPRLYLFALVFLGIFYSGSAFLAVGILIAALLRALFDWGTEVCRCMPFCRKNNISPAKANLIK